MARKPKDTTRGTRTAERMFDSRAFADDSLIELIPVQGADHRFQNPVHMSLANKHAMEFFGF